MNCDHNAIIVNLLTSMLGSITPNWRAVFLRITCTSVSVTFVLASDSPDDRAEISDVEFEFAALQPAYELMITVAVDTSPIEKLANAGQLVFARKESYKT